MVQSYQVFLRQRLRQTCLHVERTVSTWETKWFRESTSSHVRKTKTPLFACSGMRPFSQMRHRHTRLALRWIHFRRRPRCGLCPSLLILPGKACGLWLPGMSFGSRCHLHRDVRFELLPSILQDCQSFHLQGPRIVVLSLIPLTVSNQYWANRLDSPAPVISRYQPR